MTGLPTPPPSVIHPRFKLSELPVARDKRVIIDNLNYAFKKKGGFDSLRKKIWAEFASSDGKENLTSRINEAAEAEIDRDPKLLSRERGTAATLIEGAVDRRGVYKDVESEIDQLLATHVASYLETLQSIRRAEVGEEQAAEEERIGSKTDEDYAHEFEAKAAEREKNRVKLAELDRQMEEMKRKLMEAEEKKRREAQKKKEEEDRKIREAEEERRKIERERRREEERKYEEQREKEREERRRRRKEEEAAREEEYRRRRAERDRDRERERERDRDRTRGRDYRDSSYRSSRYSEDRKGSNAATPKDKGTSDGTPLDEKALDDIALELLLNESKALADKSRPKHEFDFEKAEAIESSGRKSAMVERLRRADRSRERDSKRRDLHGEWRERRRSRSRSRDRHRSSRADDDRRADIESLKQKERQEREKEAKAYLKGESQADAASAAGSHASQSKTREEGEYPQEPKSPTSSHRKSVRDDDKDKRQSSYRERDEKEGYKRSRILRSASPFNIDRYVPGGGVHRSSRQTEGDTTERDKERPKYHERDRERDRDDYKDRRRDSENYRSHDRVRDRDLDRERDRERSRSPHRKERDERVRERGEGSDNRDRERRRGAVPIDRYVPGR